MLSLIGLVLSIGLADSMNPSTIAPGLYLALGKRARADLLQFTLGVVAVNFLGGAIVLLGPGEALLALVPKPNHTARYIGETVAGVVMLAAAVVLWRRRRTLAEHHHLPQPPSEGKSSLLLGATISVVELPTAFPYFAAIAAIVDSGFGPVRQLVALAVYNVAFVLPLLIMIVVLVVAPDRAESILQGARAWLERRWPALLAILALVAGVFVTALGVTGLAKGQHGTVGRLSGTVRRVISH
jgi:cytochrome c biogenesis protein CcdA